MTITKQVVREGMRTPWGKADGVEIIADGIGWANTPGHGGLKLSRAMNGRVPDYMRQKGGWYEEDCEWSKVYVALSGLLADIGTDKIDSDRAEAVNTLRSYYPDTYERFFGETIPAGESYAKDKRAFDAEHVNDLVVISAVTSKNFPGFVDVIATIGGAHGVYGSVSPAETTFVVPSDEYDARCRFGFVIDRTKHKTPEELRTA